MRHGIALGVLALLSVLALGGCGGDAGGSTGTCPAGPASPLGDACASPGLTCEYGYDPPECGGITVECRGGSWTELFHTDPMASCFDAGADGGEDAGTPDTGAPDAGSVDCGDTTCGPDEYCLVRCTCCGIPDAGPPSAEYECLPVPTGCGADDLCSCAELTGTGDVCDEATRSLNRPCA